MTENMKNLDEEIAQQIKNDHIKKMVFTARNYSLEDVETIVCGNLNTIAYEYEKALSALRASWEKEKGELVAEVKHQTVLKEAFEDHGWKLSARETETIKKYEAEKQALEAEKKGLETQLSAWFSTFGTNQLSHAIDRLESAEKEKARLEERVRDMDECLDEQHDELTRLKAENERLFKNSVENEKIFIRNQSALARAHEALEPFATLTEYDVMSAPVAVGWLTNARKALSDPSGSVAFEKWKALQNTKQEYDKAMNVCLDKFSNQKFGSVADCLNGIFEKWKKMEAVKDIAIKAIHDEEELSGDMPDDFWKALNNDRKTIQQALRYTVRLTKRNIIQRFLEALDGHGGGV